MSTGKVARRWLAAGVVSVLVSSCGLMPGAGADPAAEDAGMVAKVRRAALAQLCERGVGCDGAQVDEAIQALGAMLDELPEQGELKHLASDDGDSPTVLDPKQLAGLMEMVNAMAGSDAAQDDEGDDEDESTEVMAAVQDQDSATPQPRDAPPSSAEKELMAGLGGIPVQTGRASREELRKRLLTPSAGD